MTRQPIRTVTATAILAALTHPLASAPAAAQSDNTTNRGRYWRHTFHQEGGFTYPPPPGLSSTTYRNYYMFYDLASEAIDSVYLGESGGRSYTYQDSNGIWQFLPIASPRGAPRGRRGRGSHGGRQAHSGGHVRGR